MVITGGAWSGTATELLKALEALVGPEVTKRRNWPPSAAHLGTALRRLAPDLRRVGGIEVRFPLHHGANRLIELVRLGDSPSHQSHPSQTARGRDSGDSDLRPRAATDGRDDGHDVPLAADESPVGHLAPYQPPDPRDWLAAPAVGHGSLPAEWGTIE